MAAHNPKRTVTEIALVSKRFGQVRFDDSDPAVVQLCQFPLPPDFNRPSSRLLIDLGPRYPELPPQDWYLDPGLLKYGRPIRHYFEYAYDKRFSSLGWAWVSFHIRNWNPHPFSVITGDNLLTAVESFYRALTEY
jgi:hypothetical protein